MDNCGSKGKKTTPKHGENSIPYSRTFVIESSPMNLERLGLEKLHVLKGRDIATIVLSTAITAGAAGGLGGYLFRGSGPKPSENPTLASPLPTLAIETTAPILGTAPFFDTEANEIAREKGIGPDSFFIFQNKTLDNLSAFLGRELYPIYPLTVLEHKGLIYDLAKEFSIPPNVIATIMTIESAGLQNEVSWVGAQGLFQVMPFHFDPKIQDNPAAMQEPYLNGRTGMKFFKDVCLKAARDGFPSGYPQNHVTIYARALMAYNAGANAGRISFDRLPDETKFYGDHFIRFALSAEIADGFERKKTEIWTSSESLPPLI